MKKVLILIFLLLMVGVVSARTTVLSNSNEFRIDLVRFDPSPVIPGSETTVYFEITNLKQETLPQSNARISAPFPFEADEQIVNIPA
jgi:hypothetical protein